MLLLRSRTRQLLASTRLSWHCSRSCCSVSSCKFPSFKLGTSISNTILKRDASSLATEPFTRLVQSLKSTNQTCTIIESSCGGLISSSLMSVPGSSAVYFGGTVAYNTRMSGKLLCGDEELHKSLLSGPSVNSDDDKLLDEHSDLSEGARKYIKSKLHWTREVAIKYCQHVNTDFAIAEGGATGPTFRPKGLINGFAVLALAGRDKDGHVAILGQKIIRSTHAIREENMRFFADSAAELCLETLGHSHVSVRETNDTNAMISLEACRLLLDRSSHLRNNADVIQKFNADPNAMHVVVRGTDEVLFSNPTELALPTLSTIVDDGTIHEEALNHRTFLGRLGPAQTPIYAIFLHKDTTYNKGGYFATTRSHAPMLGPLHNELALTASAYVNWQKSHRYCHICGSALEYVHGGTCAKCTNADGKQHFHWPRQDPSIIVLVTNPDSTHALLARSPRHPSSMYTAIAGFVEAGETFESATCREVHEEVGVTIDRNSIRYIASQPWPFPRSCMIGMRACTLEGLPSIHIDPNEIVDAKWFEKEIVYQAAQDSDSMGAVLDRSVVEEKQKSGEWTGKLLVPSKGVLARTLIESWLEGI
ncbi:hypothetical protein ACHAWO_005605 [Cyclotella atomus]|uniref:NAD(+) diphosphatase n=1 Tax=Cyclotella atomus TaxID=382360 RepID=A0ABD3QSV5_9STRA